MKRKSDPAIDADSDEVDLKPVDTESTEDFEATWRRFLETPATLGHTPGARDAWRRGRDRYAVWVFRVKDPEVLARLSRAREALDGQIEPMAARDAHVTTFVSGFPVSDPRLDDDIGEATLDAMVASLRADPPPAPRLIVGGLNAFLSCAFLEVLDPDRDLCGIRDRLAGGAREVRFSAYLPHVTAGLFRTGPTAPLVESIRGLRRLAPLVYQPGILELVEFDARQEGASLVTRATVELPIR